MPTLPPSSPEIKPLTGLRWFAAIWVVGFHFRYVEKHAFVNTFPTVEKYFGPILGVGDQGVDLFFMLSGFVLGYNYLHKLGPQFSLATTGKFLWLRLARIWPLFFVVMHVAAARDLITDRLTGSDLSQELDASSYFKQVLLVQMWDQDFIGGTWASPGWSLSAEWLAYLLCPLLALLVARMLVVSSARTLLSVAFALSCTPIMFTVANGTFGSPYSWVVRILCGFLGGMLLAAAYRRLKPTARHRRLAGTLAAGCVLGISVWPYLARATGQEWTDSFVMLFMLPLIGCLSIGTGPLVRLLSHPIVVLGGGVSFAVYLLHSDVMGAYRTIGQGLGWKTAAPTLYFAGLGVSVAVTVVLAWLAYRYIEEPSRNAMRAMIDVSFASAQPAATGRPIQPKPSLPAQRLRVVDEPSEAVVKTIAR